VLAELGLDARWVVGRPVAFRLHPNCHWRLIVSPRDVIRQDANVQIDAGLDVPDQIAGWRRARRERLEVSASSFPWAESGPTRRW